MGVLRLRLGNEVLMACRGFGWPLKKAENKVTDKGEIIDFLQFAEEKVAA